MNNQATFVELYRFKEVTFYSLLLDGDDKPLGMKFLEANGAHTHFNIMMYWLRKIGSSFSATTAYFRKERAANALPPPIEITHKKCDLRWYCLRMSIGTVIVFNGGVKTSKKAQDCPNVAKHFADANFLSEKIWAAFDNQEIHIGQNERLIIPDNYKLLL